MSHMKSFLSTLFALASLSSLQAQIPLRPPAERLAPQAPGQSPKISRKPIGTIVRPQGLDAPQPVINTNSLLKVNITYQAHNMQIPWQKEIEGYSVL